MHDNTTRWSLWRRPGLGRLIAGLALGGGVLALAAVAAQSPKPLTSVTQLQPDSDGKYHKSCLSASCHGAPAMMMTAIPSPGLPCSPWLPCQQHAHIAHIGSGITRQDGIAQRFE